MLAIFPKPFMFTLIPIGKKTFFSNHGSILGAFLGHFSPTISGHVDPRKKKKNLVKSSGQYCFFFVANTFQIQPFHKGLEMQADVAFCFMPGA
jgi:hypothetical protein